MRDLLLDSSGTKISMSTIDGVLNVLKSMEKQSRHSGLSVISSTVEGCLLSWVPLYFILPKLMVIPQCIKSTLALCAPLRNILVVFKDDSSLIQVP